MQQPLIWLVEDEQGIADTLIYMLQQEGFSVEAFERGFPVLEKSRQQCPDAIILDVGLPDISGFELCRRLLERHPALPILFLTARSDEVDRLLGLEIGADDYVAAPIVDGGRIIGVLSVGKPNAAMAPVIKRSERRMLWASAVLLGIALVIGFGMVWWINRSIARLARYADSVTENRPVPLPDLGSSELRKLAQALESMRLKLEGKNYIEQYVYALTHELKSPLAAIRGAAEILREGPPPNVVTRFTDNILTQNARMQALVETLLRQARLENRQDITLTAVEVDTLFAQLKEARSVQLAAKNITLTILPSSLSVAADPALLEQALGNLLDNAIDFTPQGGTITLSAHQQEELVTLQVTDSGSGIPDFALPRIFERFYSLPRENGHKSSGLGLAFVSEVARLHEGTVTLSNRPEGGAQASFTLHRHFT